jgi:hypothetical protein
MAAAAAHVLGLVVCLGFRLLVWVVSASWGLEGPVGAFAKGASTGFPAGSQSAFPLPAGLLGAVIAMLFASCEAPRTT